MTLAQGKEIGRNELKTPGGNGFNSLQGPIGSGITIATTVTIRLLRPTTAGQQKIPFVFSDPVHPETAISANTVQDMRSGNVGLFTEPRFW